MIRPLEGIKVLDLSRTLAGPYATMMLSDMGAEIYKIEEPVKGDESRLFTPPEWNGESCYYLAANRNKKSITVNLKSPEGIELIKKLVTQCDVLVENFRTGTMEKLGLGYDVIKEINPKMVFCSISGFGRTGPEKDRAGYDVLLQAYGGLMSITGTEEQPAKAGMSIADLSTGMFSAFSIVSALMAVQKNGVGQYLDASLLDSQVALLNHMATGYYANGNSPKRMGTMHGTLVPYGGFKTQSNDIVLAIANDGLWQKLCAALDWSDLATDKRFLFNKNRVENRIELEKIINSRFEKIQCEEIIGKLTTVGVPCGPVQNVEQVMNSPQVIAREMMVEIEHPHVPELKVPAFPVKFSGTPVTIQSPPPLLGEHTDEILTMLGYTSAEIKQLAQRNIVSILATAPI